MGPFGGGHNSDCARAGAGLNGDMAKESPLLLITGTSRGIGREMARHFLAQGYLVCGCSRGEAGWESPGYRHYALEISDETAVAGMLADIRKGGPRLAGVLNNAGIAMMNHLLLTPAKAVEEVWKTNFLGSFLVLREAAKVMKKQGGGRVINFTSVAHPLNLEGEMAYAASKAALESMTRIAARELQPMGITVNAIGPGPVQTDLIRGVPEKKMKELLSRQPISRMTTVEEIVHAVEFFLDDRSSGVTGQILYFGGVSG